MRVSFEKTLSPCVTDEVILWHIQHGWVWNVREESGRLVGVFFVTFISGDGVVVHFTSIPNIVISAGTVISAFSKALRIVDPLGVVFATVPRTKEKLISVLKFLRFEETNGNFDRENEGEILLLKLKKCQNAILKPSTQ
jgi:hypothetical protein